MKKNSLHTPLHTYQVLIIGAGAAGISVASSLLKRNKKLDIAIIDPAAHHFYQPGFTMVGGGIFNINETRRPMTSLIPNGVSLIQDSVIEFKPEDNYIVTETSSNIAYERLIICPGLQLNWKGVEGLNETLGKNGVTSNYSPEFAPYTWELIKKTKSGKAIFTQPPMPIKCAGAPQKALYLAADYWLKKNQLKNINIEFYNAGGVLFGVKEYVPALQSYIDRYNADVKYHHTLTKIDGSKQKAWFELKDPSGKVSTIETDFDMIHVCPPQTAADFIRHSTLADESGWLEVHPNTLQHSRHSNIWGLGDVVNTPNAKTAAAVRKQAPVVANNIIADMANLPPSSSYDGYGSCPLTVERGKIVLAEFGYGGKLLPTFPLPLLDGTKPSKRAWFLKKTVMPALYWNGMLKGHELLVGHNKMNSETTE